MSRRPSLLLCTYGGLMDEVVPGLRSLPHDQLVIVVHEGKTAEKGCTDLRSLLDRLKIRHTVLQVCPQDLLGSAMVMERCIQEHQGKGWRVRVDITGGQKLLSDAAVLAAAVTGVEVCCFQVEARRLRLLQGMGVREMLPKAVVSALREDQWPMALREGKGHEHRGNLLVRMKDMGLITLVERGGQRQVGLTDRGLACRDWLQRMEPTINE